MEEKIMQNMENEGSANDPLENNADINSENEHPTDDINIEAARLEQQVEELKDKYLRQVADFDNFRKRTAKERLDFIQTAGREVISSLLNVLDDCERAEKQMQSTDDVASIREGVTLVFSKLRSILQSKGLKPMESIGTDFNPEFHEAISEVPVPKEELKGKVVDEVEKGYYLNDKIIRFAKVVVGK